MTSLDEKNLIVESAKLGALIALREVGLYKDYISQNEAFRVAGSRALLESWVNEGRLVGVPGKYPNSPKTYSRAEVELCRTQHLNRKAK